LVGVVQWYGVVAEGSAKIAGRTVQGVKPVLQRDGSGFYVYAEEGRARRAG
jgi:hypothetical protein